MTPREFVIRLRNAALGFILGLIGSILLPLGMAVWLWCETEEVEGRVNLRGGRKLAKWQNGINRE